MSENTLRERIDAILQRECNFVDCGEENGRGELWADDREILTKQVLNLLKEELEGLTVISEETIINMVTKFHFSGETNRHILSKQVADKQLSHTKQELKKLWD